MATAQSGLDWPPAQIQSMSPGFTQTIYLTSDGSVWTMGAGTRGQLGNGTVGSDTWSSVPVRVDLPGPMKQVGSGTVACWALSADGRSAYAWGDNTRGQLGIGDPSVKYSTVPVKIDFDLPPGVTIVSMADGLWCNLALLSNGEVMAWGDNQYGQCGLDPRTAGQYIYTPTVIPGLTGVTALAAGDDFSLALKQNGTVWAWGRNRDGQLGPQGPTDSRDPRTFVPVQVTGLPPIKSIVCGGNNGVVLDFNGNIWEWGRNEFGELGNGTTDPSNGSHPIPRMVAGLPPIVSFDSQGPTVLAADACGDVYAWGFNKWGAVGNGQTANTGTPQHILTLSTAPDASGPSVQVAAAHRSSYAFNVVTGETYAWGENNYGQIGIPANHVPNPVPVNISAEIVPTLPNPAAAVSAPDPLTVLKDLIGGVWSTGMFCSLLPNMAYPPLAGDFAAMPGMGDAAIAAGSADLLPWAAVAALAAGMAGPAASAAPLPVYAGDLVATYAGLIDKMVHNNGPWPICGL